MLSVSDAEKIVHARKITEKFLLPKCNYKQSLYETRKHIQHVV